jgi:hypothetical protein
VDCGTSSTCSQARIGKNTKLRLELATAFTQNARRTIEGGLPSHECQQERKCPVLVVRIGRVKLGLPRSRIVSGGGRGHLCAVLPSWRPKWSSSQDMRPAFDRPQTERTALCLDLKALEDLSHFALVVTNETDAIDKNCRLLEQWIGMGLGTACPAWEAGIRGPGRLFPPRSTRHGVNTSSALAASIPCRTIPIDYDAH